MKIDSVQFNNIEEIYEAVRISKVNQDLKKMIGSHLHNLYDRCSISFTISEITPLELYILYNLSNGHIIVDRDYDEAPLLVNSPLEAEVSALSRLAGQILRDPDITEIRSDVMDVFARIMPISYFRKTAVVILQGASLGVVFGSMPEKIFINISGDPTKWVNYEETDSFIDAVCGAFYESVYKSLLMDVNTIDMISDSISFDRYYQSSAGSDIMLVNALTPFGQFSITNPEDNSSTIERVSQYYSDHSESTDWFFNNTRLMYVVNLPILVFVELVTNLPYHSCIDHANLKILISEELAFSNESYSIDKYNLRLSERYKTYVDTYNIAAKDRIVDKIIHLPASKKIQAIFSLSLEDVSRNVILYEKKLTDNLREDQRYQSITLSVLDLLSYIKGSAQAIYSQFVF